MLGCWVDIGCWVKIVEIGREIGREKGKISWLWRHGVLKDILE